MTKTAKTGIPFFDGDFSAFMDVTKFAKLFEIPELSKLTAQFTVPGLDASAMSYG